MRREITDYIEDIIDAMSSASVATISITIVTTMSERPLLVSGTTPDTK